jgi:UTP--glucose-1-phosphate uridylyltransferase
MSSNTVRKAVIPVAGLGTRFLPATKAIPKELFPLVDRPILLQVVCEVLDAGIKDVVFIAGRHKTAIEEFFDRNYELEDTLSRLGKKDLLATAQEVSRLINVISVRQKDPKGLGHAVLCAREVVGDDPFIVLLGDEIMFGQPNVSKQLISAFNKTQKSVVGIMEVPREDVSKYGIVEVKPAGERLFEINGVVEKPAPQNAKSNWALPGRYLFTSEIFDVLNKTKPSVGGEIQLSDAMNTLAAGGRLQGYNFDALRFDAGDKFGYLCASLHVALQSPEIGAQTKKYLLQLAQKLERS